MAADTTTATTATTAGTGSTGETGTSKAAVEGTDPTAGQSLSVSGGAAGHTAATPLAIAGPGSSVLPATFSPNTSGTGTADPTSVASGSAQAVDGSVASGTSLAVNGSTASGDAVAMNGSVASGCSVATDGSTASGGDCVPEIVPPLPPLTPLTPETPTAHRDIRVADGSRSHGAGTNGAGASLAFTGTDAEGLAELAGASGALGALLLALGGKGRRKGQAKR